MHDIFGLLRRSGLRDWGICSFEQVRGSLLDCRAKSRIPENARSVLMTVFPYFTPCGAHNISRYAIPPDYHTAAGEYLDRACGLLREAFPDQEFVWFADNSPIPEVRAAALAGLGCVGLNGLLITPEYGSGGDRHKSRSACLWRWNQAVHPVRKMPGKLSRRSNRHGRRRNRSLSLTHLAEKEGSLAVGM